jgi:PAS domain S-box-containing protein
MPNWMQVVWLMMISTAALLGCFHLLVWARQRAQWSHAVVAALAFSVAFCGVMELRAFTATTPAAYADALRWCHTLGSLVAIFTVIYVHLTSPGRVWLAWATYITRVAMMVVNHTQVTGTTVSYLSIDALNTVPTWGGASFSAPVGVANPFFALAVLANLLLFAYLIDALVQLTREPPSEMRRRRLQLVGALLLFALVAVGWITSMVVLGVPLPTMLSVAFLCVVLVLSLHMVGDLLRAAELARELRLAESSLHETRDDLRIAEQSTGLGLWRWNADRRRFWLSSRGAQIFGLGAAGELDLAQLLARIDSGDLPRLQQWASQRPHQDDGEFNGQIRVRSEAGTRWIAVHGRLVFAAGHAPERAHGILIDLTDNRSISDVFGLTFDASPAAMLLVDDEGRIVLANQAAAELSRYPLADLIGLSIEQLLPQGDRVAHVGHRRDFEKAASQRQMQPSREVRLWTRDETALAVDVSLNPVEVNGRVLVIAIVSDISARRERERELAMQRAALAHVARVGMLAELSGSLAHEINQPLAAILSNAQASLRFANRDTPDLGEIRDGLVQIVDSAKRAGEVIRRLRAMLRNEPPEFVELDINQAIRDVVQMLRSDLIDRNVRVTEAFTTDLPAVRGDRVQLQQVLLNLITNAADAMSGLDRHRRVTLRTQRANDSVQIEVCDVGTGIPEADLERIFQAFISTKRDGLGFGLPLCRTLVQAHGGKLWASNNRGPGATFHLLLPTAAG